MSRQHSSGDLRADRRYAYAEGCLAEGDAAAAAEMAEQVLDLAPGFAPAWALLGRAREARHAAGGGEAERAGAVAAYAAALDLDPADGLGIRLALARLGHGDASGAISPAYVRALFDGYAPRFERHLVGDLAYRGPALLAEALDGAAGPDARFARVLDLGCGTGLMGQALAGRAGWIAGVDLSPAMLALAARKGIYDRLQAGELGDFLAAEPAASADLVVAADVFIYLGDLVPALAGIARALRPGGLAVFSTQWHPASGVRLGPDARFAHGDDHVAAAAEAAGLAVLASTPAAVRRERGLDVPGRVVTVRKPCGPAPAA
ncbi:class I SAM-dependent DNA methyltransferase [Methylobacterium sp. A54F]